MFSKLNERLDELKDKLRVKEKVSAQMKELEEQIEAEGANKEKWYQQVQKEERDVEKLEGVSVSNLFYTFLGRKLEKLDKEKQEALAAKLKYDEVVETLGEMKEELKALQEKWKSIQQADREYQEILVEKAQLIKSTETIWTDELFDLVEKEADLKADVKEYKEAISAGEGAHHALNQAITSLDKAKGWSTWDMFGGGMISTAIKHSHVDDSKRYIHQAHTKLRHFEAELKDVQRRFHSQIEIGNFLSFADYFFDGFIVDWVVHGKISDSLKQTTKVRMQVYSILEDLKAKLAQVESELKRTRQKRIKMIEDAS